MMWTCIYSYNSFISIMYAFVYGTLKRNCPNHYVLTNPENGKANFVSEGRTVDLFPLIVTTEILVPFLLDKKGTGKVK